MSARKHSPRRWQMLDAAFPDGVPQAVVDAMVEAESTIAALRDRLAEVERERDAEVAATRAAIEVLP